MTGQELTVEDIINQLADWETGAELTARAFAKSGEHTMATMSTHHRHIYRDIRTWIEENR